MQGLEDGMTVRAGFIGLGSIGKPMAGRLVAAGLETVVYDVARAPVDVLVAQGARAAESPREVAASSDVVGVCVRDDDDVLAVCLGEDGILAGARPDSVIAIHSTVLPRTVEEVAEAARTRDVGVVDACITGGPGGAQQGTLTYMVGGEAAALERCRPVFETAAKKIVHAGPLGSGAKVKLCNNLMTYLAWISAYEATSLARAIGLSQEVLEEVTRSNGNMTDPMLQFLGIHKMPDEARRGEPMQKILDGYRKVAEKDLTWTLTLAREVDVELPGTELASGLMGRIYGIEDEGSG